MLISQRAQHWRFQIRREAEEAERKKREAEEAEQRAKQEVEKKEREALKKAFKKERKVRMTYSVLYDPINWVIHLPLALNVKLFVRILLVLPPSIFRKLGSR